MSPLQVRGEHLPHLIYLRSARFTTGRRWQNCFHFFSNQFSGFYFLFLTQIKEILDPKQLTGKGDRNQSNEVKNILKGRQDKEPNLTRFKMSVLSAITAAPNHLRISKDANSEGLIFLYLACLSLSLQHPYQFTYSK